MPYIPLTLMLGALALFTGETAPRSEGSFQDSFNDGLSGQWRVKEGTWRVRDGKAVAEGGFSMLVRERDSLRDVEVSADVAYAHDEAHAASGIAFRLGDDATGYAVGLREVEKGVHPEFGPWERPVLQLFRLDRDGWKVLQESKVMGCRSGLMRRLKVVCRGPNIWGTGLPSRCR